MTTREHEPLEQVLQRLTQEREQADRLYNDAFTALDRALMREPEFPHPPPPYDEQQITPLNERWNALTPPPASGGVKGRLAAFVWRIVAPTLERQHAFNSTLVDHLNRNVTAHREAQRAIDTTIAMLRGHLADLLAFQSRLVVYLQQITGYVDTKDRDTAGRALVVNAAVNALAEDMAKRWESMAAREQRFEARASNLSAAHDELRTLIGVTQQATMTMKRELEKLTLPTSEVRGPRSEVRRPTTEVRRSRLLLLSTPTSTSASKISSAARRRRSGRASKVTCSTSRGPRTCSTWAAGAASSWIC